MTKILETKTTKNINTKLQMFITIKNVFQTKNIKSKTKLTQEQFKIQKTVFCYITNIKK